MVVDGPERGKRCTATHEVIGVGTAPGNDLVLSDSTVSRFHLELRHRDGWIEVEDLDTKNGTFAGEVRVDRARVRAGTELRIGKTTLQVLDGEALTLDEYSEEALGRLLGRSVAMKRLMARIDRVAASNVAVLLRGETGTGKELIAEAVHERSDRAQGPFETVDCGALLPTLIASELFGHEKGAFTGADQTYKGAFERANGGTVFLDEIGELPVNLQPALLGVLERKSFRRVGGSKPIEVDVRIVSATNRDLRAEVNNSAFREDLYYRLAVVTLPVPPLRARTDDIPLLVEHFLASAGYPGDVSEIFDERIMASLAEHHWPGNVRELRNYVEAAFVMGETPAFEEADQPADSPAALLKRPYSEARAQIVERFERQYVEALLERHGGNVSKAARAADMNRTYLTRLIKRLGLR